MIGKFITTSLSAIGRNKQVQGATSVFQRGAGGSFKIAEYAVGGTLGYYTYGQDYGAGAGVAIGLGETAAINTLFKMGVPGIIAGAAAAGGYFAYQKGKDIYRENRALNMHRPMMDNYGTLGAMRQKSIQGLSRDRAGASRVLGNEARMLHR